MDAMTKIGWGVIAGIGAIATVSTVKAITIVPLYSKRCGALPTGSEPYTYHRDWWKCAFRTAELRRVYSSSWSAWMLIVRNDIEATEGTPAWIDAITQELDGDTHVKIWYGPSPPDYLGSFRWKE